MEFDNLVNNYLSEAAFSGPKGQSSRPRGRPKLQYVPGPKAQDGKYPTNSVEGQLLNFVEEKPATIDELIEFLQQNFDEYYRPQICKEKVRQMLLADVLDFSNDKRSSGEAEYGSEEPELDTSGEDYFDPQSYLPQGAIRDYELGQPGHH